MSKKKADKKKGGFVRAIRNIFVFLIACALLILLGLTGIYIYVKHDVNPRLLKEEDATALSDVDCIITVSYTHLDVYKRQAYICSIHLRLP